MLYSLTVPKAVEQRRAGGEATQSACGTAFPRRLSTDPHPPREAEPCSSHGVYLSPAVNKSQAPGPLKSPARQQASILRRMEGRR